MRRPEIEGAKSTYLYSLAYLALLFTLMMIDSMVGV
jgi:heme O synthase-like polyprenyltransferase